MNPYTNIVTMKEIYQKILFFFYYLLNLWRAYFNSPSKTIVFVDPIEKYCKKKKEKFLGQFCDPSNNTINVNENIEPLFYIQKDYWEMLKDPKNIVEQKWKTRILYESTPRGNIAMYYDVYKQGFSYYSDQNGIPYPILNAAAMKYVMMFYCKDFFMDEKTMTQSLSIEDKNGDDKDKNHISPLIKIYETDEVEEKEKERKEKEKKEQEKESQNEESTLKNKDAPFAKLKNYKMTPNVNKNTKKEETNKVLFKNKFIYLGKMRNFSFLQKKPIVKNPLEVSSEYDGLFSGEKMSYKDYKMKQINYSDFKKRKQEE
jgi:hypothetical protein